MREPALTPPEPGQCEFTGCMPCTECNGDGCVVQHEVGCPGKNASLCECPDVTCAACKGSGEVDRRCERDAYRRGLCADHLDVAAAEKADQRLSAMRDGD